MTATTTLPDTATLPAPTMFDFTTKGDIVTLKQYKDPTEEFLVVKENRTNHVIKSLKTGKQGTFPMHLCVLVRKADDTVLNTVTAAPESKLPDGVWPGALITAWVDSPKWKFPKKQKFSVLKVNEKTVNIVELGGRPGGYRGWNVSFGAITGVIDVKTL